MNLFNIFKPKPVWPVTNAHTMGVTCGLTRVNPDYYYGWDGRCPGCSLDAVNVSHQLRQRSFEVKNFTDGEVRYRPVFDALLQSFDILKGDDDLLVYYFSGHGGQEPDQDGDEIDGQDETQCFFDGPVKDDSFRRLWLKAPPKLRIVFISDSCNSGTMSRVYRRGRRGDRVLMLRQRPKSLRRALPDGFKGRLLHIAGCPDGMSSYGGLTGGVFTTELLKALRPGITYTDWFNEATSRMPRNQVPLMESFGESFANRVALT
jgi:hypothetical protein